MKNLTDLEFVEKLERMKLSDTASEAARRIRNLMIRANNAEKLCEYLESQLELHEWSDTRME